MKPSLFDFLVLLMLTAIAVGVILLLSGSGGGGTIPPLPFRAVPAPIPADSNPVLSAPRCATAAGERHLPTSNLIDFMNDKDTPLIVLGIVALYVFYKISLTNAAIAESQIQSTTAAENNLWLTVPGAVSQGLVGIGSILNGFDNLFTDNSLTS